MSYVVTFFAGAFLCNSIPHLASGLRGEPFPTPFAKPRGSGLSSPFVNFLWGSFNVVVGMALLSGRPVDAPLDPHVIALIAGALAVGAYLSLHFGKVRRGKDLN
jgi:hypothetical protein